MEAPTPLLVRVHLAATRSPFDRIEAKVCSDACISYLVSYTARRYPPEAVAVQQAHLV